VIRARRTDSTRQATLFRKEHPTPGAPRLLEAKLALQRQQPGTA